MTTDHHPDEANAPLDDAFSDAYDDLRAVARKYLQSEAQRPLRTTELVHEAYMRLSAQKKGTFQNKSHVIALTARMMRRVIVDEARARKAKKRGGDWIRVELAEPISTKEGNIIDVLALESALSQLEAQDARAASIVEMRCFAQLSEAEMASVLGCSDRWVRKQWAFALAWLRDRLDAV